MPSLRSIANEYHHAANKIAARADRAGRLTENQRAAIDSYRGLAAKVEALIRPEDAVRPEPQAPTSSLIENLAPAKPSKKLRQKAATPQEILERANG